MSRSKKSSNKLLIFILILVIIAAGAVVAVKIINGGQIFGENKTGEAVENKVEEPKVVKTVQTFKGDERPIAVMIDNHSDAWPQAGLNDAYIVYEIIVEGGETRLMPVFKGADLAKIGPIRSARHYFLDYAMENDAIFVHFGWSPQAERDIPKFNINNVHGMVESSKDFRRSTDKQHSYLHSVTTDTQTVLELAEKKGYETTSTQKSVLHYIPDDVDLKNGKSATNVFIPHSNLQKVEYEYDEENKVYTRYARNKLQTDWDTGENITTKNIIITLCDNHTLNDGENKGRQELENIGTFDGYYITNGKAIEIKCIKEARNLQTKYVDLEGKEIDVSDGNTWIHICPTDADVEIKGIEPETEAIDNTIAQGDEN